VDQGLTRKGNATPTDPAGGTAAAPDAGQPGAGSELHPDGPDLAGNPAGLPPDTGGRLPGQESGKSQGEKLGR